MNVLYESATEHPDGYRDVACKQVSDVQGKVRIVDVREPEEFTGELGHAPGAALVPIATLEEAAKPWPRDEEIVLICRSGKRSGRAAAVLTAMGFPRAMNMVGGMLAWNEARLPVER